MKLILIFLLAVMLLSAHAARRNREPRLIPLVIASFVVGAAFLSLRVI
jgi:NhaP-type Na+/H+ or K+/H+ antiporter